MPLQTTKRPTLGCETIVADGRSLCQCLKFNLEEVSILKLCIQTAPELENPFLPHTYQIGISWLSLRRSSNNWQSVWEFHEIISRSLTTNVRNHDNKTWGYKGHRMHDWSLVLVYREIVTAKLGLQRAKIYGVGPPLVHVDYF
ncbi:hypothetical protein Pyn_26627 [Prunus yedoensis var. nudiflora]|uniref:Uncharacterized protein n=1 Tax=Prunus yedoensis var. nudiflora TaxID=2094558 RepID=A0A314YS06_PRUYE|nr:hypothetical protein Pyn_26627 [Prunus yedoensis var. nudiflora]